MAQGKPPIDIGERNQLLIDDRLIENCRDVRLAVNPPEKREVLIRPTEREGTHECQISTVIEFEGRLLMYYMTFAQQAPEGLRKSARHVTRLAVSDDGIHWRRVTEGPINLGDGTENVVMAGAVGTVFRDPNETDGFPLWWIGHMNENSWWAESDGTIHGGGPDKEGALYLCRSHDGIHWHRVQEPVLPFWCDSRNQCFFDERIGRYVIYARARPGGHETRVVARGESHCLIGPWQFTRNPDRQTGPNGLYGWIETELPIVIAPDEIDPPHTGLYTPNVHQYAPDAYLAFPEAYRLRDHIDSHSRDDRGQPVNEGPLDIAILTSRDGVQWQRFHEPYVRLGRRGRIDAGTVYMGVGLIPRNDEIWQYCAVSPHTHHGRHLSLPGTDGGIRRLVQRRDGFICAQAGAQGGEITTPPLSFAGNRLWLNCDCSALGEIWVELQDAEGRPVPGRTLSDAVSVDMNGTGEQVWWRDGPDVSALAGHPVRLHFWMRSAKLFSFQFSSE